MEGERDGGHPWEPKDMWTTAMGIMFVPQTRVEPPLILFHIDLKTFY